MFRLGLSAFLFFVQFLVYLRITGKQIWKNSVASQKLLCQEMWAIASSDAQPWLGVYTWAFCFTGVSWPDFYKALSRQKIWSQQEFCYQWLWTWDHAWTLSNAGVPGGGTRKNKCKTVNQAHCAISVMSMWISQGGWTRVCRTLLLSLIWMTLYCVKDLISSKSLEVLCITILSAPKLNILDSTCIFVDFSLAFTHK